MIAKLIFARSRRSDFGQLARYVVDAKGRPDPATWTRTADYILDTKQGGAKVSGVRLTHCKSEDPAGAALEILKTQDQNHSSGADRTLHLVVSFPAGEQPTAAQLVTIEDRLVEAIGLAGHQRLSAAHTDTAHLHIHVAINKVHPRTYRNVSPWYSKFRLMEACDRLEVELGLVRTDHGTPRPGAALGPGAGKPQSSADMEAHAGRESFHRWVKEGVAGRLLEAAKTASNWQDLHRALAAFDLEMRLRGAGLVVVARHANVTLKASDVDRSCALKALTDRLGLFQPASEDARRTRPKERYAGSPLNSGQETGRLFARFQQEREQAVASRREATESLRQTNHHYVAELDTWYAERRGALKNRPEIRGLEKRAAYQALRIRHSDDLRARAALEAEQRKDFQTRFPLPTWQEFLRRSAEAGDAEALAVLRGKKRKPSPGRDFRVSAGDGARLRPVILSNLQPHARKNGDLVYRTGDGAVVVDRHSKIDVDQSTDEAASVALALARLRFQGERLKVSGSAEFKAALVKAAVAGKLDVTFDDAGMETARRAASTREAVVDPTPAASPSPIEHYITRRNTFNSNKSDISYIHRRWIPTDAGPAGYRGRRRLEDGSEVILLLKGNDMLVKPSSSAQVAKASQWKIGDIVKTDARGRFIDSSRSKGR